MLNVPADYYPPGINLYVPAAKYASEVSLSHKCRAILGTPTAVDVDGIHADLPANSVQDLSTFVAGAGGIGAVSDAEFGCVLQVQASGAVVTTVTLTFDGYDYLGQPVREVFALTNAMGTTAQNLLKAFKRVTRIRGDGAGGAVVVDIGWGTGLGLPYKTIAIEREILNNALGTNGTLTQPALTDPATSGTGDPRGTYVPNGTRNGVNKFELDTVVSSFVNTNNNGGLYGIRHFGG